MPVGGPVVSEVGAVQLGLVVWSEVRSLVVGRVEARGCESWVSVAGAGRLRAVVGESKAGVAVLTGRVGPCILQEGRVLVCLRRVVVVLVVLSLVGQWRCLGCGAAWMWGGVVMRRKGS